MEQSNINRYNSNRKVYNLDKGGLHDFLVRAHHEMNGYTGEKPLTILLGPQNKPFDVNSLDGISRVTLDLIAWSGELYGFTLDERIGIFEKGRLTLFKRDDWAANPQPIYDAAELYKVE